MSTNATITHCRPTNPWHRDEETHVIPAFVPKMSMLKVYSECKASTNFTCQLKKEILDEFVLLQHLHLYSIICLNHEPRASWGGFYNFHHEVRNATNIRIRYNQVLHLIRNTTWESDKSTIKHHKREPRGQPFPSRGSQGICNTICYN